MTALTVAIPDAADFVAALSAITGTEPEWHTAVVAGTSDRGRTCQIAGVEVFEVPGEVWRAESITLATSDPDAAVARLRAAGFDEVTEHTGLPVAASLNVAGICIRIGGSE